MEDEAEGSRQKAEERKIMTDEIKENPEELKNELPNEVGELQKLLEEEKAKSAEYLDNWRRAMADFSNYKKRVEKDTNEMSKYLNAVLIARLLPILDDFDRAMHTIPENLRGLTWIDGVMLIARKMQAVLEAEGLKPIEALNQPFDPNVHEAVIHEETDQAEDGAVIAELQKGYKLNDRVLRPTMVKVAKKK
jgi:molecular chaperone GrpE